jgi:uncharacterized spore protein YtfJ
MPTGAIDELAGTVRDTMGDTREAISVSRVFGEAYRIGDRTLVPVATVAGGAGGGGGEQGDREGEQPERGVGGGFGLTARPLGVYEVDADGVTWHPAVDVQRIVRGAQLLVGLLIVCVTIRVARRG